MRIVNSYAGYLHWSLLVMAAWWLSPVTMTGQTTDTTSSQIVDVVKLKDGSELIGTIEKWDYDRGLSIRLITGAVVAIPKPDIRLVTQRVPMSSLQQEFNARYFNPRPRPYAFRESGMYHAFSGFLNTSFRGGAGLMYTIGYRFNRMLGVGFGVGYESHDLLLTRPMVPVMAEVRGFFLPKKITPYYALKVGYAFPVREPDAGLTAAKGGFGLSPELGVRFGGKSVNYFVAAEYRLQHASFTGPQWGWGWGGQGEFTEKVRYQRLNLRTGILF